MIGGQRQHEQDPRPRQVEPEQRAGDEEGAEGRTPASVNS